MKKKKNEQDDEYNEYEYQLTWWNQKGRYETNCIIIKNLSAVNQYETDYAKWKEDNDLYDGPGQIMLKSGLIDEWDKVPKPTEICGEICYMRFNASRTGLQWKWYDNDNSQYKVMGQYQEEEEEKIDQDLIEQLEASFLGNTSANLDAKQFNQQFNHCLLPELSKFLRDKVKIAGADAYTFSVTFRDIEKGEIDNLEQVGYTHSEKSAFPRNLARFVNGRNSLHQFSNVTADAFFHRWLNLYRLFTEQQQQYFWCYILCIVNQMKYIDIEFENQMVLLPLVNANWNAKPPQSIINQLIDYNDVEGELFNATHFDGSLIPPLEEWQHIYKTAQKNKEERQVSKCAILRRARNINDKDKQNEKKIEYRWILAQQDYERFQFGQDEASLLRIIDCIRKFVLEKELDTSTALWPWYQNSKFCHEEYQQKQYNELMKKYNLIHEYSFETVLPLLRKAERKRKKIREQLDIKENLIPSIRHKRKWSAIVLLKQGLDRNLNYIRHYLSYALDEVIEDIFKTEDDKSLNEEKKIKKILKYIKYDIEKDVEKKEDNNNKFERIGIEKSKKNVLIEKLKNGKRFWKNKKIKGKPNLENLKCLDIDQLKFPLFKNFMYYLFMEPDQEMFKRNENIQKYQGYFYRIFIDHFRDVPDFWNYKHDILLLQSVLKNGIDTKAIVQDIDVFAREYKQILYSSEDEILSNSISQHHPLYAFQTWCRTKVNILHRLKYVTKIIMNTLTSNANCQNTIFSQYQKDSHLEFIKRKDWTYKVDAQFDKNRNVSFGRDQVSVSFKKQDLNQTNTRLRTSPIAKRKKKRSKSIAQRGGAKRRKKFDLYIRRDIDEELFESFMSFDLMKFGEPLTRFMINKLKTQAGLRDSQYLVLGQLFYSLPDPVGIEILWKSTDALQRAKPEKLKELCLRLQAGSIFKPSADLSCAELFDKLAKTDLVQQEIWKEYSQEFESMAFEQVGEIKSDHMMFVILLLPLPNHEGRCLIQLAQEGSRVRFLNNERVGDVINHMYRVGHLKPKDNIKHKPLSFSGMLHMLIFYPFRFYLSPKGYHWVGGILFVEYLLLLFAYAYFWPQFQSLKSDDPIETFFLKLLQITFWVSNFGYILFEVYEWVEKGTRQYFNLAVMGEANVMDALVSVIWIILFVVKSF